MPNLPLGAVQPPARRISTPTLILGNPGAGKTSLLAPFAEYLWDTYGKVLLLYSWDGGAIPTNVQKLMKHGLIRFWRARTRSASGVDVETAMLATKGYWPAEINPETGETSPAVRLVPPVTVRYTVSCRKTGEVLAQLPANNLVGPTYCASCRTQHGIGDLNVKEDVHRTIGFEQVGGVAFDGLTSLGSMVMDFLDEARGNGQVGGEKSAFGGTVHSGGLHFGGTNRADYNFAQTRCRQAVHNSQSIPYLVEAAVFTALALEGTDEGGLAIVGAKLPGRAATDEASSWFGNVTEMGRTVDDKGHEHFTLFLRPFTDAQNRRHLLKTSASPTGVPDMLIDPIGEPWAQANLGLVFKLLDDDLRRAMAEEIAGAPGLVGTPTSYGEPFGSVAQAPAPTSTALPPMVPATPSSPPAAPATVAAPSNGGGVAPPVARRRVRVAAPILTPTPAPAPEPVADIPVASSAAPASSPSSPSSASSPPPPPGMRPPQRVPGS